MLYSLTGKQMNSSESDVYMVILNNQLAKGRTLDEVISNLSKLFKQAPDNIQNMLCQPSFVVESGVSEEKAKNTQKLVIDAGVGCQVKKIFRTDTLDVSTLARNTQVICAKCGEQQSVSSNCEYCGIAFSKFNQSSDFLHSKVQEKQQYTANNQSLRLNKNSSAPASNNANTARSIFIGIFVLIMIVFAISALNKNGQTSKHPITLDDGQVLYAIEKRSVVSTDNYEDLIVPGYISIIDFTADWCPVCKRLHQFEDKLVVQRDDVIVRKLDVTQQDDYQLALNKYNLNFRGVPYSIVYGKNGEFIADDNNRQRKGQQYIHSLIINR